MWIQNIISTFFIFILFQIILIYFILVKEKQISQFWSIGLITYIINHANKHQ